MCKAFPWAQATSDMQLGEAGGANNLAIGGENLHEDARRWVIEALRARC